MKHSVYQTCDTLRYRKRGWMDGCDENATPVSHASYYKTGTNLWMWKDCMEASTLC